MIDRLRGVIVEKSISDAVLECSGVGFRVLIPSSVYAVLPATGQDAVLYTYMHVKEDRIELYGFENRDQQSSFKMLIAVSGVGPRVALSILSVMSSERVKLAIAAGDVKAFTQCPGIGPKLAQRLILELKDKVGDLGLATQDLQGGSISPAAGAQAEAVAAMVSLGFSHSEAAKAVSGQPEDSTVEQLVAAALRSIGRG